MIAVIADDFTGAAEMAGIGLRYGLTVQLTTPGNPYNGADIFIISTDSRSMSQGDAKKVTADVLKYVMTLQPDLLYKKIDSVLRGHVLAELTVQMELTEINRAFILPVNPSLGRTIKGGAYYIDGKAISHTAFAIDPEFAVTDSSILHMLRARPGEVKVVKQSEVVPGSGIIIGEAETPQDIVGWANKINKNRVLAGAGDFFVALLGRKHQPVVHVPAPAQMPYLYISGTTFDGSRQFIRQVDARLKCVAYLPLENRTTIDQSWYARVNAIIAEQQRCVIAINEEIIAGCTPAALRALMAKAVKEVLENNPVKEIFIEGGSTAAAILAELAIASLEPIDEWQRGVVRMRAKDWLITVKPGSYEIPAGIGKIYH